MTLHRLLCAIGIHEWAYNLKGDGRCCEVCGTEQYVATETEDGDKTWQTIKW